MGEVYLSLLTEVILVSTQLDKFQKTVIMLSFDDDDFQRLIVEEDHGQKSAIVLGARQFMEANAMNAQHERTMIRWFMLGTSDKQQGKQDTHLAALRISS